MDHSDACEHAKMYGLRMAPGRYCGVPSPFEFFFQDHGGYIKVSRPTTNPRHDAMPQLRAMSMVYCAERLTRSMQIADADELARDAARSWDRFDVGEAYVSLRKAYTIVRGMVK